MSSNLLRIYRTINWLFLDAYACKNVHKYIYLFNCNIAFDFQPVFVHLFRLPTHVMCQVEEKVKQEWLFKLTLCCSAIHHSLSEIPMFVLYDRCKHVVIAD